MKSGIICQDFSDIHQMDQVYVKITYGDTEDMDCKSEPEKKGKKWICKNEVREERIIAKITRMKYKKKYKNNCSK